ncbi:MAG TPA: PIN domain-containing protein [Solirubrobacteraceae bacterium]|jgi:predicted nucleic acid-binding protein|nr:PIN domain-containing protein [Solirubrobacteraceae bacterium]
MLLLDASVWIAAVDSEDRYHTAARALVLDPARPLGALDLTLYEIANVVGVVKHRGEVATRIIATLLKRSEGALARVDQALIEHAIALATEHRLTAYDAAYVAAARMHAWTLVSADLKVLVKPGLAAPPDDPQL